ncbi:MAG TPA: glycosyltransferase family A protein [Cellulomonadaceae bacterium]|nr:glycosyltransferase family A protein [Cellulomonadaceae bacterium]
MADSRTDGDRVVIAVLTYKRPDDLRVLLPALVAQASGLGGEIEILVVDNDPQGSGEATVGLIGDPLIRYVHEPRPGISAARNRALAESVDREVLLFIDDDERPSETWLATMLGLYRRERPAAVVGPVISEYAAEPERWISAGRFFDRRRMATGTAIEAAATNNLLLDLAVVRRERLEFDEKFGLSGGSDTLFTRRLVASGERMLWCDEAPVVDVVPVSRLTRRWVLQKAFRSGNSWARTSLEIAAGRRGRARVRVECLVTGAVRLAGGAARFVAGVLGAGVGQRARGLRTLARGAGLLAGAFGYVYLEYRRTS